MSEQGNFQLEEVHVGYRNIHDLIKNLQYIENNPNIGNQTRIELVKMYVD